jgi:tetratricopeptide (TPR) repeat protein
MRRENMESLDRFQKLKSLYLLDPGNPRLARDCVDAALRAGAYDFVLERSDRALAAAPADLHALFDRASALIGLREYRAAIDTLRAVLERQPGLVAALLNLGLCHYRLQEYIEARSALDAAYAAGDRSASLLTLLVSTYHHLGEIDDAFELCEANPQPSGADSVLAGIYALVYLDYEEAAKAGEWAARALAGNARSIDGLVVDGTLNIARANLDKAHQQFDTVLEIAPATARAFIGLGTLALLENDLPRARAHLQRGVELMPGHVGSWQVLAWAHLLSNDLDAAESALRSALEVDRNFAETHGGLASIAALRGQREEAQKLIEVALRLDPQCLSAQFARSVLIGLAGKPDEARRLILRTAAGLASGDGSVLSRVIQHAAGH